MKKITKLPALVFMILLAAINTSHTFGKTYTDAKGKPQFLCTDLNSLLDNMDDALGGNFDNFEEASYEVENLLIRKGVNPRIARKSAAPIARAIVSNNSGGHGRPGGGLKDYMASGVTKPFAASFTFNVTQVIDPAFVVPANSAVPIPLFGYLDRLNDYGQLINGLIPAPLTLAITNTASNVVFTYTDGGAKTAVITVSCNEYPYVSFLAATISNIFQLSKLRITLSDKTKLSQFATPLKPFERTMFGVDSKNTITMNANKAPSQFQDGIIDIDATFRIDKEKGVISYMDLNAGTGFQVSYACFVQALNVSRS